MIQGLWNRIFLCIVIVEDSSSGRKAYSFEEYLKVTEEQPKAYDELQTNFPAQSQSGSQIQRDLHEDDDFAYVLFHNYLVLILTTTIFIFF